MNTGFSRRLESLTAQRPVTVLGAAVVDVIADAYALPWRGCDIELKQQGVNIGGCALNIAIALKRLGIDAQNALPVGHGVWADIIRNAMSAQDLHSAVEAETGDNGWCLALVEPDGERTFMSFSGVENQWQQRWLDTLVVPAKAWSIYPAISWPHPVVSCSPAGWSNCTTSPRLSISARASKIFRTH